MIMPDMTAPVMPLIQGSVMPVMLVMMPVMLVMVPVMLFAKLLVVVAMAYMFSASLGGKTDKHGQAK